MTEAKTRHRVRQLRKALGLSQTELSKRTGIYRSDICALERGYGTLWPGHLKRIAEALEVPVAELMGAA